jgi:hypothetical protein
VFSGIDFQGLCTAAMALEQMKDSMHYRTGTNQIDFVAGREEIIWVVAVAEFTRGEPWAWDSDGDRCDVDAGHYRDDWGLSMDVDSQLGLVGDRRCQWSQEIPAVAVARHPHVAASCGATGRCG